MEILHEPNDGHQQYLSDAKNPDRYCGLGGIGVNISDPGEDAWGSYPAGLVTTDGAATTNS
jgi:peptide-methionine (S)-S-oxide reductase